MTARSLLVATALLGAGTRAAAQSWLLRFNASAQYVEFRGLTPDSILATSVINSSTNGPVTPDGYAASCAGTAYCYYYLAGPLLSGVPASAGVDMSLWGLGVQGLSARLSARGYADLSPNRVWPGTSPPVDLLEGYLEYVRNGLTIQGGRTLDRGRLASTGSSGVDGLRTTYQFEDNTLEVSGYAGWGLARGTILPVTSPAVDPLADYQPTDRQIVVGATAGVHLPRLDVETEYRREIDPATDYIVAERAALTTQVEVTPQLHFTTGADYDLAQGEWGSIDGSLAFSGHRLWATLGGRHYRPFFDLWTVWGVFSPVPYNGINGSLTVHPIKKLQLRGTGEWFRYDDADVDAPNVDLEDRGWRWGLSGTYNPGTNWTADLATHGEFLPGASSSGLDGHMTWRPHEHLELGIEGGSLERPLELRFQDAGVQYAGGSVDYRAGERWRVGLSVDRYWEARNRPDAQAIDWNQWRMSARISLTLRSAADRWLPPPSPGGPNQ